MKTMTVDEFRAALQAQGIPLEDVQFQCPRCKTPQSARDLIAAGAGADFDAVEKYLAFSCVGRFDVAKGCDWTLGGLFHIHELEVVTPDGKRHPRFMPLTHQAGSDGTKEPHHAGN